MFLETVVPENGSEPLFNTPVFRWPFQKGKQTKYDFQLSKDNAFSDASTIAITSLSGAIYNPHRKLNNGTWYWRYRVSGKAWSDILQFLITEKSLPFVSPVAETFLAGIPSNHPRVLINAPIPNASLLNMMGSVDGKAIIHEATNALTVKVFTEKDAVSEAKGDNDEQDKKLNQDAVVGMGNKMHKMVLALCQAQLLNQNKAFQDRAITIAMEISTWDHAGITGSSDFMDGVCMYDMALVFDTFYDGLTTSQKEQLLKAIHFRAAQFYKSWVNNIESKVLSGHVWQLLLNEFINTGIALYKHDPEAADWLKYAYDLFLARAPVLGGVDGGWGEGAYYFHMNIETLVEIPQRIKAYTGFDFIATHPWYKAQADWLIYHSPPGSSADGYGDNTEELFEPLPSYASFAQVMGQLTQNAKYTWYANKLISTQKVNLSDEIILRWFRLSNSNNLNTPKNLDNLVLPMGHLSKETGVATLHTDPKNTSKDLMVAMRSSPFGAYGHILADQNTFNILFGGKRLFYRTGYKVSMNDPHRLGWSKHTKSMNGVLINGEGQPYSAEAYGYFSRFLQGEQLAYMKGDASNAYQSNETKEDYGVTKFNRHIVLLKPGIIVIYDELASKDPVSWSWLIHSLENMQLDTIHNEFSASIQSAKGTGKLWSSEPFNWNISNRFDVPAIKFRNYEGMKTKEYKDTQWHLKATNKNATNKIRFLSVMQVGKDGKLMQLKEQISSVGSTKIVVGDWTIAANLSESLVPQLTIESKIANTVFSAYGNDILFKGQKYAGKIAESSKLIEWVNGKMRFVEMRDEPLAPIR